jgi:hypothetical protein
MQKNTPTLLAIFIAMGMWLYNFGRIAQSSTSQASLEATGCHHRASAWDVLPWQPPWLTILNEIQKQNVKRYSINHLLSTILGRRCFVFLFRQLTEQLHQGDMNNPTLMSKGMFLIPNNISFKDAIRSD